MAYVYTFESNSRKFIEIEKGLDNCGLYVIGHLPEGHYEGIPEKEFAEAIRTIQEKFSRYDQMATLNFRQHEGMTGKVLRENGFTAVARGGQRGTYFYIYKPREVCKDGSK